MSDSFSEADLLSRIFPEIKENSHVLVPPGDDCAVIKASGKNLLVTVDQVIETKHYLQETEPYLAGKKLMARNISDIAAMGGVPRFALMASASSAKSEDWLFQFHKGVIEEGDRFGIALIGGDLATSRLDAVNSLTLIGEVEGTGVLRSGAKTGDIIFATGEFGASFETEHHLNFSPRLEEGQWLRDKASSMIDVTDGLLIDLKRICQASSVSAVLETAKIPLRASVSNSLSNALTDGEDYELLFSVNQQDAETLKNDWPFSTKLTMIGSFSDGNSGEIQSSEGENLIDKFGEGFDHFK